MDMTSMTTTNTALATAKLEKSLTRNSLMDFARAKRRSMLLVDSSSSMSWTVRSTGKSRHASMLDVVADLRSTSAVPVAAFYGSGQVRLVDEMIPAPTGGTPMLEAIEFGKVQGATHLVIVTDGQPADPYGTLRTAKAFGGVIDVFYIGDGDGLEFSKQLAEATGGSINVTDLGAPKQLAAGIAGLLGDGGS